MKRGFLVGLVAIVLAISGTGAVTAAGVSAWGARSRLDRELALLQSCREQTGQIQLLRTSAPAWACRSAPAPGLAPRVSATLSAAGLPASMLSTVSPEAESESLSLGDLKAQRRRATLVLQSVTLPQLGTFLAAWREHEPDWIPARIDLSPEVQASTVQAKSGDLPLRAVISLETLFLDPGARH